MEIIKTEKYNNQNTNFEIANSNAFSINTNQMSYFLKSNNSIKNENLYLKSLEIKTGESLNLVSYRTQKDEIQENIYSNSNNTLISDEKMDSKNKRSKDASYKFSISSSNKNDSNSKPRSNNIGINKSDLTIEEDFAFNNYNKSITSKKNLNLQQKSSLSINSNIPEEIQSSKKKKLTENDYEEYGDFDYDFENSSKSKQISNGFDIDDEIEEEIIIRK